jgi:hypothetical protein
MESLQISSPSMSILPVSESPGKETCTSKPLGSRISSQKGEKSVSETAPRLSLMKGSFDRPFGPSTTQTQTPKQYAEKSNSLGANNLLRPKSKHSADGSDRSVVSPVVTPSFGRSKAGFPNLLDRSEHSKHRASAASVHLQNMRISHHLRSESSFSNTAVTTGIVNVVPASFHTLLQRGASRSGSRSVPLPYQVARRARKSSKSTFFSKDISEKVPIGVVSVQSNSSSVYSESVASPVNSPAGSILRFPRPLCAETSDQTPSRPDENVNVLLSSQAVIRTSPDETSTFLDDESRPTSSECAENVIMPGNLSSSNLSKGSKSSKTSRFKEDFDTVETSRTTKRSSIANIFTRSKPKRSTDDVSTLDGSVDEPRRLQRAIPLTERHDAADLFSKAIKAQQTEKSSMYLSVSKERAEFEMIRKRSTSSGRQPSVSQGKAPTSDSEFASVVLVAAKTHKYGEPYLKPEFSLPDFTSSARETFKRKPSAFDSFRRLKPEFSLPIFLNSEDSKVTSPPTRTRSSVPLDPMDKHALALKYGVENDNGISEGLESKAFQIEQRYIWNDIDAMLPVRPSDHGLTVLEYITAFQRSNSWATGSSESALQSLSEILCSVLNSQVRPPMHVTYDTSFSVEQLLYAFVALQADNGQPQFPDELFQQPSDDSLTPALDKSKVPSFELNDRPVLIDSPPKSASIKWASPIPSAPLDHAIEENDDPETDLGSWSRYPSHTRGKRTGSAGQADQVKTYDFAYHVNSQNIATFSSSADDKSPRKKGGKQKSEIRKARTGLPKSKSMMIGKEFFRNYARLIRSPSVEWLSHGKGHRSSVAAGGSLAHPELEVLPPVFAAYPMPISESKEEDPALADFLVHKNTFELQDMHSHRRVGPFPPIDGCSDPSVEGEQDSLLRGPEQHAASSPDLLVSNSDNLSPEENALSWSRHYESCVELPRESSVGHTTDNSTALSSTTAINLIDAMLASASDTNSGVGSETSSSMPVRANGKHEKMVSVTSIRASSMDLLKKLAEAEEREKMRCYQSLMNDKRAAEEGEFLAGKSSTGGSICEEAESMKEKGDESVGSAEDLGLGGPV